MFSDLRFAFRMLAKTPAFTAIAVATVALGIGANSAIFSVIRTVLLQPLPYHDSGRLIDVFSLDPAGTKDALSIAEVDDLRAQMQSFQDLAGFQSQSVNVTGGERPERVRGAFVSTNYFKIFQLTPVLGRTLIAGEDRPGAAKVAVVNEKLWRERLNSAADLSDKKLILNGEPYSIVGVVPESFKSPFDRDVEVWISMANFPGITAQRDSRFLIPLGHLKPSVSLEQAQAEANTIARQFASAFQKENAGRGLKIDYYRNFVVGEVRPMLWLLFVATGVILLIACANLGNLLLARGVGRRREMAVRAALGASRWRLVRQLIIESTLLGLAGGVTGILLAHWAMWALLKLPQNFVSSETATIDTPILFFALAVALLTGWLFGLAPALRTAQPDLHDDLKEGGRGSGEGAAWNRWRAGFVVAQVAFSIVLLIAAALLVRSFDRLLQSGTGFDPNYTLTLEYRLPRTKYSENTAPWNFHRQVIEQAQQLAGVQSAALVRSLPFSGNGGNTGVRLLDRETPPPGQEPQVNFNIATGGYFSTARIPLLRGRLFGDEDRAQTTKVFLINETMARRFWPNQDPIGKQIQITEDGTTGEIVGIVGNIKQYRLNDEPEPQVYAAYSQNQTFFATLVIRTTVDPMSLSDPVRNAIWRVDPDQPMWKIRSFDFLVDRSVANRKFALALMSLFAALALVLTVVGLYGVLSYIVSQRTPEIGIRMALGAQRGDVLHLILRQSFSLVSLGIVAGIIAALGGSRLLQTFLYEMSATDLTTYAGVVLLLGVAALFASYIPARRATRVDPMVALRYE